jgi:hypothetical protein
MKLIFELVAQDVNVGIELQRQRDALKALNKELKGLDEGTAKYNELKAEAVKTKLAISDLTDQQKKLNNEFKATKVPTDSLAGLRLEYSKLTAQLATLSAAERNSDFGKSIIKSAAKAKLEIDSIEQSVGRFTGNVGNYQSAFNGIAAGFGKIAAVVGILSGGGQLIDATRQTEKLFAVLSNSIGDEQKSLRVFEQIKQFATETPFQLNEVVESFIKLEQRNFNPTIEQLRVIGDIASSQGKTINQFTEAILDAQTGEFERLKEFGIIAKKNGDDVTLSFRGQSKTIKNTSENISNYLLELGKLPGVQGAASAVAKTLDGSLSNLSDNFTQLLASIGSGGGIIKSIADSLNFVVAAANNFISVPLSEKIEEQRGEFSALIGILQDVNTEESTRTQAIAELQSQYGDYIGNVNLETASQEQLASILQKGNELFLQRIFLQQNEEKYAEFAKRRIDLERKLFEQRKDALKAENNAQQGSFSSLSSAVIQTTPSFTVSEIGQLEGEIKDFKLQQDELAKSLFGSLDAADKAKDKYKDLSSELVKTKDKTKDSDKETKAAAGSIEFLKKRVSDLTTLLERAPQNQIPKILGDLVKAEEDLKAVEERLKELRNPTTEAQTIKRFEGLAAQELGAPDNFIPQDLTDAEREAAVEFGQIRIDEEQFTDEQILALRKALSDKTIGLTKDEFAERERMEREAAEKRKRDREQIEDALFDSGLAVTNAIADERTRAIEDEKTERLSALDIEYEKRKEAAQGNAQLLLSIDEDYQKKKAEIEKEAARERKRVAIIESIIAGALSVVKALPNVPLAIATGIAAATQTAIIASKKFAFGGFTGKGNRHDETGERVAGTAVLHEDEYVAPRAQVQQYPHLFNWLDRNRPKRGASRGYGFAVGGFSEPPAVSFSSAQATKEQALSLTAVAVIDEASARLIAKYVGEQTYSAVAQGIGDADRTNERKQKLTEYTEV